MSISFWSCWNYIFSKVQHCQRSLYKFSFKEPSHCYIHRQIVYKNQNWHLNPKTLNIEVESEVYALLLLFMCDLIFRTRSLPYFAQLWAATVFVILRKPNIRFTKKCWLLIVNYVYWGCKCHWCHINKENSIQLLKNLKLNQIIKFKTVNWTYIILNWLNKSSYILQIFF